MRGFNGVLFLVAVILAAVAFFEPGIKQATELPPLTSLQPHQVQHLVFGRPGREMAQAVKTDRWTLQAPFAAPADSYRINALLALAQTPSLSHYPLAGVDLAQLQLDPPQLVVELNNTRLELGGTEPLRGQRYVRVGETIHLIDDRLYFTGNPVELVDPTLLPGEPSLVAISLPALPPPLGDGTPLVAELVEGRWQTDPSLVDLSADVLPTLVDGWRRMRALDVRQDPASDPEAISADALPQVLIRLAGGETIVFEVTSQRGEVILRRPAWQLRYVVSRGMALELLSIGGGGTLTGESP